MIGATIQIYKCSKCHHEWETVDHERKACDWCGAEGKVLEEKSCPDWQDWKRILERMEK